MRLALALTLLLISPVPQDSIPPPRQCELARASGDAPWKGSCGAMLGESRPVMTLTAEAAIQTGTWRSDATPSAIYRGQIAGRIPGQTTAIEVELYGTRPGVIRTPIGWYEVTHVVETPTELRFRVDDARLVAPSDLDRAIIERAAGMLATEAAWARSDDRPCAADSKTWSIYCAMERASREVTGGFHPRRAALQIVRAVVDERTAARSYPDRLMGYNNDKNTTLADVQGVFKDALGRIRK
ncbi:MAG TPA: hypothetical protein VFO19_16940 [Vicinamibacterales bacterium]|nr:hypothetical protein [Vicinamibacterales bacterium]